MLYDALLCDADVTAAPEDMYYFNRVEIFTLRQKLTTLYKGYDIR